MMKFNIVLESDNSIEDDFWNFVENNEVCSIQAECELVDGKWSLEIIPNFDEDRKEFMKLCSELVDHLEDLGYGF